MDGAHHTSTDAHRLWRRLDLPGHEVARLVRRDEGWDLAGTAVFAGPEPCRLDYVVRCDRGWHTRSAVVTGTIGRQPVDVRVEVEARRWRANGVEQPALSGCVDIDLGFSPSTNLLPIRRLGLDVGGRAEITAAWLPFPSLAVAPLSQVYEREGPRSYRYESAGGAFTRVLEIDDEGLVVRYPGIWEAESLGPARVAPSVAPTATSAASVRAALIAAAVTAYEDAGMRGLCAEGAWEAAVSAMRSLRLDLPE